MDIRADLWANQDYLSLRYDPGNFVIAVNLDGLNPVAIRSVRLNGRTVE